MKRLIAVLMLIVGTVLANTNILTEGKTNELYEFTMDMGFEPLLVFNESQFTNMYLMADSAQFRNIYIVSEKKGITNHYIVEGMEIKKAK